MENQTENQPKKLNVLFADDNFTGVNPFEWGLKQFGYNVKRVYNGLEAVTYCRENPDIDLVLMDIRMPVMDGIEATIEIRKFTKKLVIFAISGYYDLTFRERIMAAGCNDYIEKPVSLDLLAAMIKKYQLL
jgi:CheY-like chemotaxis protein